MAAAERNDNESHALYTERQHWSILRDKDLGKAAMEDNGRFSEVMVDAVVRWGETKLGQTLTDGERQFVPIWIRYQSLALKAALGNGSWREWPLTTELGMDKDPLEIVVDQMREMGLQM